ncbi:MAG: hypothetical protein LBT88_08580 [Oscillospiraceae bacterium]|jgi:uncharacterized HAD superfamily protein|nr:hypothetical protein [Oscillospiraceae bacterium]
MNIGIDLDGVLTNISGFYRFNRELRHSELNDTRDIFHCSDELLRARWKRYLLKYSTIQPARTGARELLRKLKKDGHKVFIITKRVYTCRGGLKGRIMRLLVRGWLMRNKILFQRVVFCDSELPGSKRDACLAYRIDVLVDDEPVNIYSVPETVTPICIDARYNRSCVGENILRAKGLDETYRLIHGLALARGVLPVRRRSKRI